MIRHFCADCDLANPVRFEDETFSIDHAGLATEIKDLSGWRCTACGQIEFDTGSAQRYAAGGDELVLRARECEGTEISVSAENQARAKPQRPV